VLLKRHLALSCIALLAVAALRGQSPSSDEIRLDSRPYKPSPEVTLRVQANLVDVRVVVRDSNGQPVPGLQQSDFQLFDNGKPQTISAFTVETRAPRVSADVAPSAGGSAPAPAKPAPPRYVALFFDDMNMPLGDLVPARKAAQGFIRSSLEPGDRVGIFTSSTLVTLDFTSDTRKLLDAVAQLRPRLRRPGGAFCPRMGPYLAHLITERNDLQALDLAIEMGVEDRCLSRNPMEMSTGQVEGIVRNAARTTLFMSDDFSRTTMSVLKDVIQILGHKPGRRTLVLASSGFLLLTSSVQRQQDKLVDIALRAGVIINSLDASGLVVDSAAASLEDGPPIVMALRPDLQSLAHSISSEQQSQMSDPLAMLAHGTGGRFFHNNNDLSRGLHELAAAPSVSYLLGFAPANLKFDGNFHELKVKLATPAHLTVEARRGYHAPTKAPPLPSGFAVRFESEVMGSATLSDLNVDVTSESARLANGLPVLRVLLRVDPKSLPFQRRGDRNVQNLRFILALFDTQGKFLAGLDSAMNLALKDDTLARVSEKGLEQGLSLQAPPGSYKLRLVLEELMNGKMAALSRPVEIR
jgi:VWFA-related protein